MLRLSRPPTLTAALALCIIGAFSPHSQALEINPQEETANVAWGRILARDNCARCHATEIEGESPNRRAPPFWQISERRSVDTIADMLVEQSGPKHSEMPNFRISRDHANRLAAWISWVQPVAHGKRLVEENCARCHAVSLTDGSRHPDAPAFRTLSEFYPLEGLEESFAEGIVTGHPDMPIFHMSELQLSDVIVYLATIQQKPLD